VKVLWLLAVIPGMAIGASHRRTAADVAELIFTSLYSDRDDRQLARQLEKTEMDERLASGLVMYFRSQGLGPHAIDALQKLSDRTAHLALPHDPPLSIQPVPMLEEREEMLQRVFQYALSYVTRLPNFMCDQVTARHTNMQGPRYSDRLHYADTVKWNLRFVNGAEEGNLLRAGGKGLQRTALRSGQSLSRGEFGEDLLMIFAPDIHPQFGWHHWEMLRGKRTAVFSYYVGPASTRYEISWAASAEVNAGSKFYTVRSPIGGLVFVDPETGEISRLIIQTKGLPPSSPVKESRTIIDYGAVDIGGQRYTLPVKASLFIRADPQLNWNEISYVHYRRFEAESVVTYSDSTIKFSGPKK
jgi:hypothetical protein